MIIKELSPIERENIAKNILTEIDDYCVRTYDGGHRTHLGASLIGRECSRFLFYVFRWTFRENFSGQKQRLFNRGHREEERFVEWLRGIGAQVWTHDETAPLNDKLEFPQYRVSGCDGHFGGSLDGIAILPERFGITEPILLEFKTNGTGPSFNKLLSDKMAKAKPEHYAQTSVYGFKKSLNYCLYLNICKNDDVIHVELVKLNHTLGQQMEEKAARIINAKEPPPRLSDNPTFYKCKTCPASDVCFKRVPVEKNCRSCLHALPIANAEWRCALYDQTLPKEFISLGCSDHESVNV